MTCSDLQVQFKFVYILEAHATDTWPMPSSRYNPTREVVNIPTHTCIEERVAAATALVDCMKVKGEVLVDTMDDIFNTEFSAWPVMFYAIRGGKLEFKGMTSIVSFIRFDNFIHRKILRRQVPEWGVVVMAVSGTISKQYGSLFRIKNCYENAS